MSYKNYTVIHIRAVGHEDPKTEGWVGITGSKDPIKRWAANGATDARCDWHSDKALQTYLKNFPDAEMVILRESNSPRTPPLTRGQAEGFVRWLLPDWDNPRLRKPRSDKTYDTGRDYVVYHITKPDCPEGIFDGYVGITGQKNPESRWQAHQSAARCGTGTNPKLTEFLDENDDAVFNIIADGLTQEEAYSLEALLRPKPHTGLNILAGGAPSASQLKRYADNKGTTFSKGHYK